MLVILLIILINAKRFILLYFKYTFTDMMRFIISLWSIGFFIFISLLSWLDNMYLNNTLLYTNNSSIGNVYIFVLTTIMLFSIDVAIIQIIQKNVNNSENNKYMGIIRIKFLYDTYFEMHSFRRSKLFCSALIYFTIIPVIIFNHNIISMLFSSKYYFIYSYLLSIWQSISIFIICLLVFLIISDFSISKYLYVLSNDSIENKRINKKIYKNIVKIIYIKIIHDYINHSYTSLNYVTHLYNDCNCTEYKEKLISMSIYIIFRYKFSPIYYIQKYLLHKKFTINLLSRYMNFLNNHLNNVNYSIFKQYIPQYLKIIANLYNRYGWKQLFDYFQFKDSLINNNVCFIIPPFVYSETNNQSDWDNLNTTIFDSDLISYALTNKPSIIANRPLLNFKYDSKGYKEKQLDFVQGNLEEFIIYYLKYISRHESSKIKLIKENISYMFTIAPVFLRGMFKDKYFKSEIDYISSPLTQIMKKYLDK